VPLVGSAHQEPDLMLDHVTIKRSHMTIKQLGGVGRGLIVEVRMSHQFMSITGRSFVCK
jgi:hypothetical protein